MAYVNQIARGELYRQAEQWGSGSPDGALRPIPHLNDVVGITICDFVIWPDNAQRRIASSRDGAPGRPTAPSAPIPMLSRWEMTERRSGAAELGQIQLVFLELPKYDASRPPETVVEKWAYFFREADNLTVVPEVLAEHPFASALDAARTAGFTAAEWEAYILAGIAIQNERGALSVAEKRGEERGEKRGREQGLKDGRAQGLRFGIEALCNVLAIELTAERTRHMNSLDEGGLTALFAHLQQRKAWP
jgi:hypothetical protein